MVGGNIIEINISNEDYEQFSFFARNWRNYSHRYVDVTGDDADNILIVANLVDKYIIKGEFAENIDSRTPEQRLQDSIKQAIAQYLSEIAADMRI